MKNNSFKGPFSLLNYFLLNGFAVSDWPNKMFLPAMALICLVFDISLNLQLQANPVGWGAKSIQHQIKIRLLPSVYLIPVLPIAVNKLNISRY